MKGDLGKLMQQAQESMAKMQEAQEEVARLEVTGEAGGGMVKVLMNGKHAVKRVSIDNSLIGEDKDMLEDLVAAAMNDAVNKATEQSQQKMSAITSGLNLPPGFNLPF